MPTTLSTVAFRRVFTDYAIKGVARITWELRRDFTEDQPHLFQLQVSPDGGSSWSNVGIPVLNGQFALDDEQRAWGKALRVAYRVVLTTSEAVYESEPAQVLGLLSERQWLQARAIIRRVLVSPRGLTAFRGYLLKQKTHGTPCPICIDPFSGAIKNSDCTTCRGTGISGGYWRAAENTMYDLSPEVENTRVDGQLTRGTVNDEVAKGKFVGIPVINRGDVWVDAMSDRRYHIGTVGNLAEIAQVPIVVVAELRLAPMTDVIYSISLEGS